MMTKNIKMTPLLANTPHNIPCAAFFTFNVVGVGNIIVVGVVVNIVLLLRFLLLILMMLCLVVVNEWRLSLCLS